MARPEKYNAEYFPHDNSMRNDRKIKAVRARFGLEGYAVYSMMLESLSEADLICLKWNEIEIEMIAGDFGIESTKLIAMVEYFFAINLFQLSQNTIFCDQLDRRLRHVFAKRNATIDSLRSEKGVSAPVTVVTGDITELPSRDIKVKESKGNKRLAQNPKILAQRFELFWKSYPKKRDRKKAWTAFKKINPDEKLFSEIIASLNKFVGSNDWIKENGQFIPYPSTWLNGEQWTDELETNVGWIDPHSPEAKKLAEINQILKQRESAPPVLLDKYAAGQNYDSYPAMFADLSRIKSQILARQ